MREKQFVSFQMDNQVFGIDILAVREIIRNVEFTPVEHAPNAVLGLLNLRGQIITVLDLGPTLGLPASKLTPGTRCIILKTAEETSDLWEKQLIEDELHSDAIGLIVDGISDVVVVEDGGIEAPPANANGVQADFLKGVVKLEEKLMMVLALKPLVDQGVGQAEIKN